VISATNFDLLCILSIVFLPMMALATLLALINQVSGTPYISGGDSPAGTDCSGLASWVSNAATDRPVFGDRFHTSNEEGALAARGFQHGTAPNALVIGWNGRHTAVTLPDGTPVSSGEGGGVRVGGGGAYQPQFNHHMFLAVDPDQGDGFLPPPPPDAPPAPAILVDAAMPAPPAPEEAPPAPPVQADAAVPAPAPDAAPAGDPGVPNP
jgi:hypothetical protein